MQILASPSTASPSKVRAAYHHVPSSIRSSCIYLVFFVILFFGIRVSWINCGKIRRQPCPTSHQFLLDVISDRTNTLLSNFAGASRVVEMCRASRSTRRYCFWKQHARGVTVFPMALVLEHQLVRTRRCDFMLCLVRCKQSKPVCRGNIDVVLFLYSSIAGSSCWKGLMCEYGVCDFYFCFFSSSRTYSRKDNTNTVWRQI